MMRFKAPQNQLKCKKYPKYSPLAYVKPKNPMIPQSNNIIFITKKKLKPKTIKLYMYLKQPYSYFLLPYLLKCKCAPMLWSLLYTCSYY